MTPEQIDRAVAAAFVAVCGFDPSKDAPPVGWSVHGQARRNRRLKRATPPKLARYRQLLARGYTVAQTASECGVTPAAVYQALKRANIAAAAVRKLGEAA